jgi:hypothetical protein
MATALPPAVPSWAPSMNRRGGGGDGASSWNQLQRGPWPRDEGTDRNQADGLLRGHGVTASRGSLLFPVLKVRRRIEMTGLYHGEFGPDRVPMRRRLWLCQ